jgi:hypothetical protein
MVPFRFAPHDIMDTCGIDIAPTACSFGTHAYGVSELDTVQNICGWHPNKDEAYCLF